MQSPDIHAIATTKHEREQIFISDASARNVKITLQALLIVLVALFAVFAFYAFHRIENVSSQRETIYIKLDAEGGWSVVSGAAESMDFYEATVNATLFKFVERCYSRDPYTFDADFEVCLHFLSPRLARAFYTDMSSYADEVASTKAANMNRNIVRAVRTRHLDLIPTKVTKTDAVNALYETRIYATEYTRHSTEDVEKGRIIIEVKWRFRSWDERNATEGGYLVRNPLGIEIVERSASYEMQGDNS